MAITGTSGTRFDDLGLALQQSGTPKKAQLDQSDFLKLMTTQLKNQDPTKPMDNAQFLGQIAQFSTVSGIQALQESFSGLATSLQSAQTLQATQLVGHGVLVPASSAPLGDSGALQGAVDVTASGTVAVDVVDASGQVVRHLDLGSQPAGLASFHWDGLDASGQRAASGRYAFRASLNQSTGTQALSTYAVDTVDSVAIGSDGITLQLHGLGATRLADVRQIF